jgi:hypothetical protein
VPIPNSAWALLEEIANLDAAMWVVKTQITELSESAWSNREDFIQAIPMGLEGAMRQAGIEAHTATAVSGDLQTCLSSIAARIDELLAAAAAIQRLTATADTTVRSGVRRARERRPEIGFII